MRIVFAVEAAHAVHHFEVDPKQLIKEIVISSWLFHDEQSALEDLLKEKFGNIPIARLGGFSEDIGFLSTALINFRKHSSPFNFRPETPEFFKEA